jgi:hypothetical protein
MNGPEYVYVEIYDTHAKMLTALKRDSIDGRIEKETQAAVLSYRGYDEKGRKLSEVGTVYFCKEKLTPANIVHEFTHVALRWARDRRLDLNAQYRTYRSAEEQVAFVVGNLMYHFYASQKGRIYFLGADGMTWKDLKVKE